MLFPSLYQMVPNEDTQYNGIVQLLLHFQWRWIGLLAMDDDNGDKFLQRLLPELLQNGICEAFTFKIPKQTYLADILDLILMQQEQYVVLAEKNASVFFVYGKFPSIMVLQTLLFAFHVASLPPLDKVWITTSHWDFYAINVARDLDIQTFHGALSFSVHSNEPLGFQTFLQTVKPFWANGDGFVQDFWELAFDCVIPMSDEEEGSNLTCTGEEKLESLPQPLFEMLMTGHSYNIYTAVYAVAQALHAVYQTRTRHRVLCDLQNIQPSQVIFPVKILLDFPKMD